MSTTTANGTSTVHRTQNTVLTQEEQEFIKRQQELFSKTQSLLLVSMLMLHEESAAVKHTHTNGKEVLVQGLIDSCTFVACVIHTLLRYLEKNWRFEIQPRIRCGFLNYHVPSRETCISTPHVWVETTHEKLSTLCYKVTNDSNQALKENKRVTDIAGGITHRRYKQLLGKPFHADMGDAVHDGSSSSSSNNAPIATCTYTDSPEGEVINSSILPVLQEFVKAPLKTLQEKGGKHLYLKYRILVRKLEKQAGLDEVGKYKVNLASLGVEINDEKTAAEH